jgi:hypothetical protein
MPHIAHPARPDHWTLGSQRGRGSEAHPVLSDIYSWFTGGFDTVDPKDTQAMLDELPARTAEH